MRLFIDLDRNRLVRTPGYSSQAVELFARCGDVALLEISFVRDGYVIDPSDVSDIVFSVKSTWSQNPSLVRATTFVKTGTGENVVWTGVANFNTTPISNLIGNDAFLRGMAEVRWNSSGYGQSAKWVPITIDNAVDRPTDSGPGPASISGVDQTITTIADLAAIPTTSLTPPIIKVWVDLSNTTLQVWVLLAGTTDTEVGTTQRPSDYHDTTNQKVWYKVG